jgi:serine phosphatase RsbU (regulator of sigma subunit)
MVELKGHKQTIGKTDNILPFVTHYIFYEKGHIFYLFTDGFADQFGGPKGKKFKYRQLEETILANSHKPLDEQCKILEKTFEQWRGSLDQVDDVTLLAIKI